MATIYHWVFYYFKQSSKKKRKLDGNSNNSQTEFCRLLQNSQVIKTSQRTVLLFEPETQSRHICSLSLYDMASRVLKKSKRFEFRDVHPHVLSLSSDLLLFYTNSSAILLDRSLKVIYSFGLNRAETRQRKNNRIFACQPSRHILLLGCFERIVVFNIKLRKVLRTVLVKHTVLEPHVSPIKWFHPSQLKAAPSSDDSPTARLSLCFLSGLNSDESKEVSELDLVSLRTCPAFGCKKIPNWSSFLERAFKAPDAALLRKEDFFLNLRDPQVTLGPNYQEVRLDGIYAPGDTPLTLEVVVQEKAPPCRVLPRSQDSFIIVYPGKTYTFTLSSNSNPKKPVMKATLTFISSCLDTNMIIDRGILPSRSSHSNPLLIQFETQNSFKVI